MKDSETVPGEKKNCWEMPIRRQNIYADSMPKSRQFLQLPFSQVSSYEIFVLLFLRGKFLPMACGMWIGKMISESD